MRARRTVTALAFAGLAQLASGQGGAQPNSDGGAATAPGFRLEHRPAIDDVFGDANDYRRTIDRFLELTAQMQTLRDDFARSVQTVLAELQKAEAARPPGKARSCPTAEVAGPYARAHHLGGEYLRIGRELTRHYDQVKEFDRLGESLGLTPDYRWKVRRVLVQYGALLTDYREMKVAFHDQLNDELRYATCDLQALLLRGDPTGKAQLAANDDAWPQPGTPGAPGVPAPKVEAPHETLPPSLPTERVPELKPITLPKRPVEVPRSGILFYIDNTKCARASSLFLDGKRLGDVPPSTRVGFQTAPGPHDLCLAEERGRPCGQPGTVRRAYLHEGWTISLRCE
jgi:hypothetical protein